MPKAQAAVHAKQCAKHDFLSTRAAELSPLAITIPTNLASAEDTIQSINHTLAELASLGVARKVIRFSPRGMYQRQAWSPRDVLAATLLFQPPAFSPQAFPCACQPP